MLFGLLHLKPLLQLLINNSSPRQYHDTTVGSQTVVAGGQGLGKTTN